HKLILDDLDIRASDILQSNGIIWVEGPSDRIFFNKWIELWSDNKFREGAHYQCLIYGGKLLKHLRGDDPEAEAEAVSVLRLNRNATIVIDSDRASETDGLNATKQRILAEFAKSNLLAWVTAGREVENYIPTALLTSEGFSIAPGPFEDVVGEIESNRA